MNDLELPAHQLRKDLPDLPPRLAALPIDARGFPVPYFVAWIDGKPDHRVMDAQKIPSALHGRLCWMCGQELGAFVTFCIGPMCCITRTIAEPPSHRECVEYAVRACPFLTRPHAHRRAAGMPEDVRDAPGLGLKRNPGVIALWTTKRFDVRRVTTGPLDIGNPGLLFELGLPVHVQWWAEGRAATVDEVDESVRTGLPHLEELARDEDRVLDARGPSGLRFGFQRKAGAAMDELGRRVMEFRRLLERFPPAEVDPASPLEERRA